MMHPDDIGFTPRELWGFAWVLVVVAAVGWWGFGATIVDEPAWQNVTVVFLAVAVTATASAAVCAVLSGVKAAEHRLRATNESPQF